MQIGFASRYGKTLLKAFFLKDLASVSSEYRLVTEEFVFTTLPNSSTLFYTVKKFISSSLEKAYVSDFVQITCLSKCKNFLQAFSYWLYAPCSRFILRHAPRKEP